jgi:hypothetical protein
MSSIEKIVLFFFIFLFNHIGCHSVVFFGQKTLAKQNREINKDKADVNSIILLIEKILLQMEEYQYSTNTYPSGGQKKNPTVVKEKPEEKPRETLIAETEKEIICTLQQCFEYFDLRSVVTHMHRHFPQEQSQDIEKALKEGLFLYFIKKIDVSVKMFDTLYEIYCLFNKKKKIESDGKKEKTKEEIYQLRREQQDLFNHIKKKKNQYFYTAKTRKITVPSAGGGPMKRIEAKEVSFDLFLSDKKDPVPLKIEITLIKDQATDKIIDIICKDNRLKDYVMRFANGLLQYYHDRGEHQKTLVEFLKTLSKEQIEESYENYDSTRKIDFIRNKR